MSIPATKLTYQDYLLFPEDGKQYEILDGALSMTPAPLTRHQTIVMRLSQYFMNYLEQHPLGSVFAAPCDVLLGESDVVQPDLLLVLNPGKATITEKHIQGPPDLVVEVLSPTTAARDRELKRKRYEHFGVREYWLVDPAEDTVEILSLRDAHYAPSVVRIPPDSMTSSLLPDFTIDLPKLFR